MKKHGRILRTSRVTWFRAPHAMATVSAGECSTTLIATRAAPLASSTGRRGWRWSSGMRWCNCGCGLSGCLKSSDARRAGWREKRTTGRALAALTFEGIDQPLALRALEERTMIYESVSSAVVSALAADCIDNTSKQAWQKLYQAGEPGRRGGVMVSADLRQQIDCWLHARLHDQLIPRHWAALVAKYSTHQAKKVQAISLLRSVVATPAPALFLYKAITTWAIPKLKGVQPALRKTVSVEIPVDGSPEKQARAVRAALEAERVKRKRLMARSSGMIVLPDEFYDMNTWDLDGKPESTRREWRRKIHRVLDEMVDEALVAAEQILNAEGLLAKDAA